MPDFFVEVETDFEYVAGELNEKAARFLLDFFYIDGQLGQSLYKIADALHDTALQFLELQGIRKDSNLGRGIEARVKGSAIELRSTAYHIPAWGKKNHGGKDQSRRNREYTRNGRKYKALALPKSGHNRVYGAQNKTANIHTAYEMIMPQEVDFVGATGGHYSLAANPVKDADGNYTGAVSSHASRYGIKRQGTRNVQYYGAHVEFGHRTRDGGGIGFVQARPHLRPALRTVSEASRGYLASVMSYMLLGRGDEFDSISINKDIHHGFVFGEHRVFSGAVKKAIFHSSPEVNQQRALKLRNFYSVDTRRYWGRQQAKQIGFGKNIDFERYGYDDYTRELARKQQRGSPTHPVIEHSKGPTMTKVRGEYYKKHNSEVNFWGRYPKNSWSTPAKRKTYESSKKTTTNKSKNKFKNVKPSEVDFDNMSHEDMNAYRKEQLGIDADLLAALRKGRGY